MTRICVPIFVRAANAELEEAIEQAEDALAGVEGMIELRADTASVKAVHAAIDLARVPVIVTVRPTWEGGHSQKSDRERLELWEAAIDAGAEYVDVELQAWEKSKAIRETLGDLAEKAGTRIVLSNHCFEGRPKNLEERLKRLRAVKEASVLKIAWKAQSIVDAIDALRLTAENRDRGVDGRPMVALAMGEEGLISRVLAKKFGAPFTFAVAERGKESAPGQPSVAELRGIYRWARQAEKSPMFGVIGWPVGHSLSPHIHNAGFDAVGADGVYVPLAIKPDYESFRAAVDALRATSGMDLRGLSVTIPHKENAIRYVTENGGTIDETSKHIGVINTIVWGKALRGLNTDYAGALDALVTAWSGKRADVKGKRVAVIGAGGAARAIVAGLAAHGAAVTIYNRSMDKAQALANEFRGASASPLEELASSTCDAYINCTPLGMHPKVNASPLDGLSEPAWGAETVVFDTVYNPRMTKLLKQAQKLGAKIITGDEMFVRQAAIQFKEFTGREAPLEVFREVLGKALRG